MGGRNTFILDLPHVAEFDLTCAQAFVDFWSQFYNYRVSLFSTPDEEIDYFSELNIGNALTKQNIRRLLRWKDPRFLTECKLSGRNKGHDNPRVVSVLNNLGMINQFRNDEITEHAIRHTAAEVFPHGIIWRAFLLHIAKPYTYPIADQNVFRACSLHTGLQVEDTWETYTAYCAYYRSIADTLGVLATIENLHQLKLIDNALFVFGQSLKAYHPLFSHVGY
jgi:hypothetical protein